MKKRSNGLYKRVASLKAGETASDPTVSGLRYVARKTGDGVTVYAQLRLKNPVTGKWQAEGLGKLPSRAEIDAAKDIDAADLPPEALGPALDEHYAFSRIRAEAAKHVAMARRGIDPKAADGPHGVTVAEAIEKHVTAPRAHPLAPSTLEYYGKVQRLYLGPWAKVPLRRLDGPAVVKIWETIHKDHGRTTATMSMRLLAASWRTARFHDNRIEPLQLPRGALSQSEAKKSAITTSALPQWFKEASMVEGQRLRLWLLAIMTGMRRHDLHTVRREHFDRAARTLHVPKPKGGERRAYTVPHSDAAFELVDAQLRSHNSEWLWPSGKQSKSGHIEDADPLPADGFSVEWTMHDLRRCYASVAAVVVPNDYHVKALMNHKLKGVTGGYIAFEPEDCDRHSKL